MSCLKYFGVGIPSAMKVYYREPTIFKTICELTEFHLPFVNTICANAANVTWSHVISIWKDNMLFFYRQNVLHLFTWYDFLFCHWLSFDNLQVTFKTWQVEFCFEHFIRNFSIEHLNWYQFGLRIICMLLKFQAPYLILFVATMNVVSNSVSVSLKEYFLLNV